MFRLCFCLSGSPSFHLLLSQRCPREEMWHHHPVRRGAEQLSGEWQRAAGQACWGVGGGMEGTLWSWEEQEDRAAQPSLSLSQNSPTRSWKASTFPCLAHGARALWLPPGLLHSPSRHHPLPSARTALAPTLAAGGPFQSWSLAAWHLLSFFTFSSRGGWHPAWDERARACAGVCV